MNGSLFALNETGGAIPTVAGNPADFNGGTPVLLQKLCVDQSQGGAWVGGLQYTLDGRMCITITNLPVIWIAGLPLNRGGRLCCTVGGPIAYFKRGIPMSLSGLVVLANAPPLRRRRRGAQA